MEINVYSRSKGTKALIENSAKFFEQELKLKNSTYTLDIYTEKDLVKTQGCRGIVNKVGPKYIMMLVDSRLDFERMVVTLAHEMVHVKQFARGQVKSGKNHKLNYWLGKKVKAEYYDRPWEVEAFSKERVLANKIFAIVGG
jgi:hypothetical protein